jgi:hypothetical protein
MSIWSGLQAKKSQLAEKVGGTGFHSSKILAYFPTPDNTLSDADKDLLAEEVMNILDGTSRKTGKTPTQVGMELEERLGLGQEGCMHYRLMDYSPNTLAWYALGREFMEGHAGSNMQNNGMYFYKRH